MPKRGTNIFKRKDGRWEARYVKEVCEDGSKKYGSVYAKTYREAREKQLERIQKLPQMSFCGSGMLLRDLMWNWLHSISNKVKLSTYIKYESMVRNHLTEGIGQVQIRFVNGSMIDRFADQKLHGINQVSPKTVNDILVILKMAFSFAEQEYGMQMPPIRRVKEQQKEMRVLSQNEQKVLENYLLKSPDSYKLGVLLALHTGLRIGELCALQWEDIHDGRIEINKSIHRVKNGSSTVVEFTTTKTPASNRVIPFPGFLEAILGPHRSSGSVMKTPQGKTVEPRLLQMRFKRYVADCNLEKTNFHALRHTFATRCVEAGFDTKTLSEILGHTDVKTTLNRYVHSSYELKQRNMEKLNLQINL